MDYAATQIPRDSGGQHSIGSTRVVGSRYVSARPSLEFMAECDARYSLIFLDGDHSAHTIYREVPTALGLLGDGIHLAAQLLPGRVTLLGGHPDVGPWLATKRLGRGGTAIARPVRRVALAHEAQLDSRQSRARHEGHRA